MFCSPEDAMDLFLRQWADNGTELVISIDRGAGGSEPCKIDWIRREEVRSYRLL